MMTMTSSRSTASFFAPFAAAAVLLAGAAALAEEFEHEEAGIEFAVPSGWKIEPEEELTTVTSGDGGLSVMFWAPAGSWEKALDDLDEELGKVMKNIKTTGEPEQDKLNGMKYVEQTGTGVIDGVKVEWTLVLLMAKKPMIFLGVGEPKSWKKNEEKFSTFVRSIKRM